MDRSAAAQERRIAVEMTESQRRIMDTVMAANRLIGDRQEASAMPRSNTDFQSETTKFAAEVAAKAATAATLAALKHRTKSKASSGSASVSRSTSATSSLSSGVTSSKSNETRVDKAETSTGNAKISEPTTSIPSSSSLVEHPPHAEAMTSRPSTDRSIQTSLVLSEAATQTKGNL
jgi:hypothetical protein